MNRYTYVEGAPETFVDHLGFFRAAAALEAQRLAAAEAAWLAGQRAIRSASPTNCSGYGCYSKWQAEAPARRLAAQPLHVRGYAYAMQVVAYQAYQRQVEQYEAENYAFARAGTTREREAQRIYQEKLAIHQRWVAEQTGIEAERAQLLFYDTMRMTGTALSDPSTATHLVLDVLGMIPLIGEPADGINALIYLAEGDELNAGLSAAGMIPIGGMAVTGARAVKTAVGAGIDAMRMVDATSSAISMAVKLDPPTIKPPTGALDAPTAPGAAAAPSVPKQIEAAPVRLQIEAATPAKLDELAAGKEMIVHPFSGGGTHLTTTASIDRYIDEPTYGAPSGLFVSPTRQIDELLESGATRPEIERTLGLEPRSLAEGDLVRLDIPDALDPARGLGLPDPSIGNAYHVPNSGLTLGGLSEAVIVSPLRTDSSLLISVVGGI